MTFVGSIVFLLVLLRYIFVNLSPTAHINIKEVSMKKTFTVVAQKLVRPVLETIWAIGAGGVATHLSA